MKGILMRSGVAIIFSFVTIFLFFNAINLGNNYYRAATAISQARADYEDMESMLNKLDFAILDFSKGGIVKETAQGIGKATSGLIEGLGKFLGSLAEDDTPVKKQESYPPKIDALDPPFDNYEYKEQLSEIEARVNKLLANSEQELADLKVRAAKTTETINSFRISINAKQESALKIKSEIPSAFWQWFIFLLSLFGTIIAWYETFFPIQIAQVHHAAPTTPIPPLTPPAAQP